MVVSVREKKRERTLAECLPHPLPVISERARAMPNVFLLLFSRYEHIFTVALTNGIRVWCGEPNASSSDSRNCERSRLSESLR